MFSAPEDLAEKLFRPLVAQELGSPAIVDRREYGRRGEIADEIRYSIVIPFYGDAFFVSAVFHLQRLLDDRFEVIIVVDDPRIWSQISQAFESHQRF